MIGSAPRPVPPLLMFSSLLQSQPTTAPFLVHFLKYAARCTPSELPELQEQTGHFSGVVPAGRKVPP